MLRRCCSANVELERRGQFGDDRFDCLFYSRRRLLSDFQDDVVEPVRSEAEDAPEMKREYRGGLTPRTRADRPPTAAAPVPATRTRPVSDSASPTL